MKAYHEAPTAGERRKALTAVGRLTVEIADEEHRLGDEHQRQLEAEYAAEDARRERERDERRNASPVGQKSRGRCFYCGGKGMIYEHVLTRSRGGTDTDDNKVLACVSCNSRKGNRSVAQLREKLGGGQFWAERELGATL